MKKISYSIIIITWIIILALVITGSGCHFEGFKEICNPWWYKAVGVLIVAVLQMVAWGLLLI
jgi:hypothetical protein